MRHETHFITIQVSAPLYWGFKYKIPRQYVLNTKHEDLINELKQYMTNFFTTHNLVELAEGVSKLNLCIHQNLLKLDFDVIYACSECHCKN